VKTHEQEDQAGSRIREYPDMLTERPWNNIGAEKQSLDGDGIVVVEDLKTLFDYGYWANDKLGGVLSQLTTEQFTRQVAGSYGSIRNTMVHMLSAEWGWLERCGGAARGPALDARDYPTVTSVFERWQQVEAHVREFLSTLRDEDLVRVLTFTLGDGVTHSMALGDLLHHAAIHGVHHRGQVALLLRTLGHVPGNFDILLYYGQRSTEPGVNATTPSLPRCT
jgi:uncharacterized damage-inducible protein DinB